MTACQELLRQGLPSVVPREFNDEHRFIPLAVDINGDLAVTAFLCRLPHGPRAGQPGLETSEFQRRDGTWAYLGGGAGEFGDYPLAERPQAASQGGYLRALGYGDMPHRAAQVPLERQVRLPWNAAGQRRGSPAPGWHPDG